MVLEAKKFKVMVPAWSGSDEVPLPGLQMAVFFLCPHMVKKEITSLVTLLIKALEFLEKKTHQLRMAPHVRHTMKARGPGWQL